MPDTAILGSRLWDGFRLRRVSGATSERGGWDVVRGKIVGLRRRPRTRETGNAQEKMLERLNSKRTSLSSSVLGRWELWILDPSKSDCPLQVSSLAQISEISDDSSRRSIDSISGRGPATLSFTRLSSLIVKGTRIMAGFGNTTGIIELKDDSF